MICHQKVHLLVLGLAAVSQCSSFLVVPTISHQRIATPVRTAESTNDDCDGDDACCRGGDDQPSGEAKNDDIHKNARSDNSSSSDDDVHAQPAASTASSSSPSSPSVSSFYGQLHSRKEQIQVERTRTALEEQHTRSFLKRRPVKLPYPQARKWVQANLGAATREEYEDLVENGNLRTPYIPKQPEKYYTSTREWISWDHFLTGVFDDERPSAVQPQTGVFD